MSLHALYATTEATPDRPATTYRIGLPTTEANAHARHQRFDLPHYYSGRRFAVGGDARAIRWWEVRQVDAQGYGLGAARHVTATRVLVHDVHALPEGPHDLHMRRDGEDWYVCKVIAPSGRCALGVGSHPMIAQQSARRNARCDGLI